MDSLRQAIAEIEINSSINNFSLFIAPADVSNDADS